MAPGESEYMIAYPGFAYLEQQKSVWLDEAPWIPCFEIYVNKSLEVTFSHWSPFHKSAENNLIKFSIKEIHP